MTNQKTIDAEKQIELDRKVLHILLRHQGKANRIGRWELVDQVFGESVPADQQNDGHLWDREIRYSVGRLRAEGHLICDLGDGTGRWMASRPEEFWEFYNFYVKPIKTRAELIRSMKKAANEKWPDLNQPSLFDLKSLEAL
jgi:hypothetical protein